MPPEQDNPAWVFERQLVPAMFGPWARDLLAFFEPKPGDHVLDAGCGTGAVARLLPPLVGPTGRAVGLDFDPDMLAVAAAVSPGIEWREGDLQDMGFESSSFDLVTCQQGLQFLPDRHAGLSDIRRVPRPAGRLSLSVWTALENCPGHAILFEAVGELTGKDMSTPPPWSLADEDELATLMDHAGLVVIEAAIKSRLSHFPSAKRFVEALMAGASKLTREAFAQVPASEKSAFIEDAAGRLSDYEAEADLAIPMETRMLLAGKA